MKKSVRVPSAVLLSVAGTLFPLSQPPCPETRFWASSVPASPFPPTADTSRHRKGRAVRIDSSVLTRYVTGVGSLPFFLGGLFTGGVRPETGIRPRPYMPGPSRPATALSNIGLAQAIKRIGPAFHGRSRGTADGHPHRHAVWP